MAQRRQAQVLRAAAALALLCGAVLALAQDPSYDHQTATYYASHKPVSVSKTVTAAAFFSPDHSIDTLTALIEKAESTVDIATPGFSSWGSCTGWLSTCVGCSAADLHAEPFPIFPALLNAAIQRGVRVRILTNNYAQPTCVGQIAPLDYLALNNIAIRYYTSTTFMHAKYMQVDGKVASVSSVNYSKTSFMKNREAGMLIYDDAPELLDFFTQVFEADYAQADAYVVGQTYNSSVMAIVNDRTPYPVSVPPPVHIPNAYVSPAPVPVTASVDMTVFASPDSARDELMQDVQGATKSFQLMMYQVTDPGLCSALIALQKRGIDLTLLVSYYIFDADDWKAAQVCYHQLYSAGLKIRRTPKYYSYSHQKFWIVDGTHMGMSTGNWSPTDYPDASVFPTYNSTNWIKANRDFNIKTDSVQMINIFATVLSEDYQRGYDWSPSSALSREMPSSDEL